ncbi:RDD family protein [Aneurinibacillus thermoaerophilus]|uniref:Uncharacterized membrane protein YckC, RDD family n=1 Tax=Aneurinibacillus thermoaerophilus TaxID=143495 RepID=A0A1G7WQA4_ANETH|nr:RDD family protein [Aneurinibacillus thermoaerophilus]MED0675844.1 RDD family protein [Aneurinibacillus thermoaerophilus]MED0755608.1 RDD family protein [Aneurinibacillus thermoaerophilus]MED0760063.1 RDD family protein [Aneurinibacillus thermoaerophilus]SDG73420.1 Uncharacterized membrane protein YckC, RDD family [Aneurinibacillus thermoaerophilus]
MEHESMRYAGFWIRFLAALIDAIVLMAVMYILGLTSSETFSVEWNIENLIGLAYYIILTGLYGQTLGKMIIGVKVVRTDGSAAGWGAVVLRETIGKILSAIVFFLGFIWAGFDKQKQAWHDKIASTYIVKTK